MGTQARYTKNIYTEICKQIIGWGWECEWQVLQAEGKACVKWCQKQLSFQEYSKPKEKLNKAKLLGPGI